MRKFLIGCGIVFLVMLIICTGAGIWAFMTAKRIGNDWSGAITAMDDLNGKFQYTPPTDNALTEESLDRFFGMRDFVLKEVQAQPLVDKILKAEANKTKPNVGMIEMFSFIATYPPALMRKVAAEMEAKQMAPREYLTTGRLIYVTLKHGKDNADTVLTGVYDKLEAAVEGLNTHLASSPQQAGKQIDLSQAIGNLDDGTEIPTQNYELLQKYEEQLLELPQLTFFEFYMIEEASRNGIQLAQ